MYTEKQIKVILQTQHYHGVFVEYEKLEKVAKFFEDNQNSIKNIKNYGLLMPAVYEVNHTKEDFSFKFAPLLKEFLEDNKKTTLITADVVLSSLLKEDKRDNFFKFLFKKNKNIVLFSKNNIIFSEKTLQTSYKYKRFTESEWEKNKELFERLMFVKEKSLEAFGAFKDPLVIT